VPNRLAAEQSPYLLQHQDNPVDWYPWGDAAFARARDERKPIFLSVGYSTCHWCHVMERESFENADVADLLNREFVSIKVDREERPDVDRVYMTFVQATTGSGGWPMSVWLTPELQPFYGGTYFPPTSRWGRPGFVDILGEIARVWKTEQERVLDSARTIVARLTSLRGEDAPTRPTGPELLRHAVQEFAGAFDARRGGFGSAPKFPRPSELLFLLREHYRTGTTEPLEMVTTTLRAMALGGMRDHLGGGFHRYSVDGDWRVPHFEKMLYDQAQLAIAYSEASQATGDAWYLQVAVDTLDYVSSDLTDAAGGFYSAEDADSVPPEEAHHAGAHPSEGAFYIWRDAEIREVLGPDAAVFCSRFGVLPDGNAPFDPQGEFTGRNLLYIARDVAAVAEETSRSAADVEGALARSRLALVERRASRPRPHLDDKVLTAWNGLAIAAFARVARVLSASQEAGATERSVGYLNAAHRAARFIRERMWDASTATLLRRYRNGTAGVDGYAEDYAYLIFGLLELFQAEGDPQWLEWSMALQRRQDALFADRESGGWFSTTGQDRSVLLRLKDDHDGAEPAASSVGVHNLLTLTHLVGASEGELESIDRSLGLAGAHGAQSSRAMPMMLAALSSYDAGVSQLVVVGDAAAEDTRSLLREACGRYLPSTVLVPVVEAHRGALERLLPWVATMGTRDGRARAFFCREFACQAPATSAEALRAQLNELRRT
jgi:uncharacterized protein YyaL (SSP411 family)